MLLVHQLSKSYGITSVLSDISFVINDGEHVGLVGPNGAGKSTLLRCLVGLEQPDRGVISRVPDTRPVGYLAQAFDEAPGQTVGALVAAAQAAPRAAEAALQRAAEALGGSADMDAALAAYDAALARFEALGGYDYEQRAAEVLHGLGLGELDPQAPLAALSGGQKTRLGLASLLLREPDLLLLDEPTNHLDVEALAWLEAFVRSYPGAVLIVSHDRAFLDQTAERILYLDPRSHTIASYVGNYSDFAEARAHAHALHVESWKLQQAYIARTEQDIARLKGQALGVELTTTPRQPNVRRVAKKVARKAKSRERKLERYLESDERVEQPRASWQIKLDFGPPPPGGRAVLRLEDVSAGYGAAPPLFSDVDLEVWHGERVAIVGPNGAGKTTLLRVISGQLDPRAGRVRLGTNVRLGLLAQEQETLDPRATVLETVRQARPLSETEARNFLHFFLFGGDSVFRPVGACSLGERSRLQLALLVLAGCNLLVLDEPLNHLDIEGREHFEAALAAFEGTVIVVAHDRAFLHSFAERVVEVRDGQVRSLVGGYEDYLRGCAPAP